MSYKKLQVIAEKLSGTEVWECEMLHKLVVRDHVDQETKKYLFDHFPNPYKAFTPLLNKLYFKAQFQV